MIQRYSVEDLRKLWLRIRDAPCTFQGTFIGLREAPFDYNLSWFQRRHYAKVRKADKEESPILTKNLEKVLSLLTGSQISKHHLTCAGKVERMGEEVNSALCIHFQNGSRFAIAIPGVVYRPTIGTREHIETYREH
jgi:hypothetical protein